jgi:hypothetical protein
MRRLTPLYALCTAGCAAAFAPAAHAQLIAIKTLPIADGEQFNFFPSANQAMGGVSVAISDSLLDPFVNPAKGARLRRLEFFGSPTFYSISHDQGGGQTLPVGGLVTRGDLFGGFVVAVQQLDPSRRDRQIVFNAPTVSSFPPGPVFPSPEQGRSKTNRYAYGTLGRHLTNNVSIAGSVMYAALHRIDGVDQLYQGSQSVSQYGDNVDARLGIVGELASGASFEALMVHEHLSMTHDVAFSDAFYDPNFRTVAFRPRLDHNLDRTNTWGMHVAWQRPVGDSGWRIGAILTGNLLSHPKLPNYQLIDAVRPVPWDPGHSAAYNIGIGVSQHLGTSTFALDAIYEPILSHTWGEAPSAIQTALGLTIPTGGKTTENHFVFSNVSARLGFGQDFRFGDPASPLRVQGGVAAHSTHYWLTQDDHVNGTSRKQSEEWVEWTPTWGASKRFGGVELRYFGQTTRGTGRPGVASDQVFAPNVLADASVGSILAAPSGPLHLTAVSVTTHQISISVPLP